MILKNSQASMREIIIPQISTATSSFLQYSTKISREMAQSLLKSLGIRIILLTIKNSTEIVGGEGIKRTIGEE